MGGSLNVEAVARINQLSEELSIGTALRLRIDPDQIRPILDAAAAYLIEEYSSSDLYIPAAVTYPIAEIRADFKSMSIRALCRKYRISRKTVYRLLDDPA